MDPDHLEDDEIGYEFNLRGMAPVITRHRLQTLRDRLLMELRGEVSMPNKNVNPDATREVKLCSDKFTVIERLVFVAADTNCVDSMTRILSRLSHISSRLDRTISDDHRILNRINTLKSKLFSYVNLLSAAVQGKIILKDHLKVDEGGAASLPIALTQGEGRPLTPVQKITGTIPKNVSVTPGMDSITEEVIEDVSPNSKTPSVRSGADTGHDLSAHFDTFNINEELDRELMTITDPWKFVPLPNKDNVNNDSNYFKQPSKPRDSGLYEPHNFFSDNVGSRVAEGNTSQGFNKTREYRPSILKRPSQSGQPNTADYRERNYFSEVSQPIYQDYTQQLNRTNLRASPVLPNANEPDYRNVNQAGYTPRRDRPLIEENIPVVRENLRRENTVRYRNPIPSWNLVFSGDGKGVNVNQFLRQVELTARADRVTNVDLLESAIHLFVGPARNWYIAFESMFLSWEELTRGLRQNFVSEDSDFILLKEIELRVQGKDETFVLYLSGMLNLFHHLKEPLTERKKLDMVMRNMNPFLADRVALLDIRDTQHLAILCKKIEDVRTRSKSFRQTTVESYPSNNYSKRYVSEVQRDPSPVPIRSQGEVKCVNCREMGHGFVNCKRPKMRVFCYICGELGQLSTNCDTCHSKSKNASTRSKRNVWDGIEM